MKTRKIIGLVLALLVFAALPFTVKTEAKTKEKDPNVKSVTFKTTTGGDFVAGVCKMKISFKLDGAAKDIKLNIVDISDEVVYSETIKSCKKNKAASVTWSGKDTKGKKYVDEGFYSVQIVVGKTSVRSDELDVANGTFKFIRKSGFAGGDGSEKKPYEVKNLSQLQLIEEHNGQYFKQTANIDLDYGDFKGIFSDANRFTGSYDGNEKSISNGIFTEGLFHFIGEKGEVKNLTLTGCNVDGHYAGVISRESQGTIKNCKVKSCNVSQGAKTEWDAYLGGITGINSGKIVNCEVTKLSIMDTTGGSGTGGICGNNSGNIIQCTVKESEIASKNTTWKDSYVGGLSAVNTGNITNSTMSETNVVGEKQHTGAVYAGLFVGKNNGVVSGCSPKSSDTSLIGTGNNAV